MSEVRFLATIGADQLIRPPSGIQIPGGEVEVVIRPVPTDQINADAGLDEMAASRSWLLSMATEAELTGGSLPDDLAQNHDHYAHGKPLS